MRARGLALMEAGQPAEAVACYEAARALDPNDPATLYNLGNAHLAGGDVAAAERAYRAVLAIEARHPGTHNNLGNALRAQGRLAEAADSYRAAIALQPDLAGTQNNLGSTLIALRRPHDALAPLREAVRLRPADAEACNNLGGALLALDRLDEALGWFNMARLLDPALSQAVFGAAMALLAMGRLPEGFRLYESRWRDPGFLLDEPVRDAPVWDGAADPAGRTILVHAEQGFGDTIQFVRYVPLLRARGARVLLEVQAPLVALCAPLADEVFATGAVAPPHDLRCPLLSLPERFGTTLSTIPASMPYLLAQAPRRPVGPGPHVGLVISGATDHPEDDLRSIPAALWAPLLALPATFHLLQPQLRDTDADALRHAPHLVRYGSDLTDFSVTANVVAGLDVVVSVDSAVAHLAGAMGRPVFLLLQRSADFRWLRERADSPWYPTAKLFRQAADATWPPVIARVADAVAAYVQPPSTVNV